jgi:AAA domain/Toprim domain
MLDGGELHCLQFIGPDGEKRFLAGGRVTGCYFSIGAVKGSHTLCIAEGYATAATIYEATGYPVAVAFNAGNLEPVARSLRAKFPDTTLIICSDDDVATDGNPGLTKATAAARAVGGKLAVPDFGAERSAGATDFNDMAALCGPEGVARAIGAANFTSDYTTAPSEVKFNREVNAGVLQQRAKETDDPVLTYLPLLGQEGYFVKDWSHILAAYPKSGKTELTVRLVGEWREERVLYFSEEPESVWKARLRELPAQYNHVTLFYGLGLTQPELLARIRQGQETVVIIDTIRNLLGLRDEKDNSEVARVLIPFIAACREGEKTLIVVHHDRKGGGEHGEGITGGHAFLGAVDIALELKRDGKEESRRRLIRGWGRVNEIPPLLYELQENSMIALGSPGKVALQEVQSRAQDVLTGEWVDTKAILDSLDAPKPSRDNLVRALEGLAKTGAADRDPPISAGKQQGKTYKWRAANFASDGPLLKAEVKLSDVQATGAGEWTQEF